MSHVYNAIKNRDASQKICEGVYTYIKIVLKNYWRCCDV
jgi:hypothetical protein